MVKGECNNKSREVSINKFAVLYLSTLLSGMGYNAYGIGALQLLSYAFECLLIAYTLTVVGREASRGLMNGHVSLVGLIICLNYLLSPNEPEYSDLLKYLGYYGCFMYGSYLARRYDYLVVKKIWLYSIVFIPLFLVAFVDNTYLKNLFFRSPNGFVYLGCAIGAFYLLIRGQEKKYILRAIFITCFYILICTSLGVVVAALLAILILSFKREHLVYLVLGAIVLILAIMYIDIPLFIRIRDVTIVWQYIFNSNVSIQNVDFAEINQLDRAGERTDTSSSVWRIVHWIQLFKLYVDKIWTIPFGMGAGYSVKTTGLYPHNDYLLILTEYGLIVFIYVMRFVVTVYRNIKKEGVLVYFVLTMLLYHFTENLLNNFPPGAILYFVIGWLFCKSNGHVMRCCNRKGNE